jgi:hypothetical protein
MSTEQEHPIASSANCHGVSLSPRSKPDDTHISNEVGNRFYGICGRCLFKPGITKLVGDRVCNAFPLQKRQIAHLCVTSEVFADLCDDYSEVVAVLERLERTRPDAQPDNKRAEIAQLERQLGQEIASVLESVVTGPGFSCQAGD